MLILRGMQGVFIAGLPAAALAYMGEEFEPKALLTAVGLYIGANSLGGVSGRLISGLAAAEWGWRSSFLVLAVFDLICLLLVFWMLPASRRFAPRPLGFRRMVHNRSQPRAMAVGISLLMFGTLLSLAPGLSLIVIGFFINACGFFFTHSLAAGWVTGHAQTARASATSLYLM
ncbi:MAG: MFS transporter, partial [Candidatus Thiodiazotropha sp. (ex Dulcina madagascariensis)]|nr:MFS transporter [Candidatus Thiodiazotropha sp. (ex Dulcina madagascariensis)]